MSATRRSSAPTADQQHQQAVLLHLLTHHPALLTVDELRRVVADDDSFAARDAVTRAVRDLEAAGTVQRLDRFVLLTQAAVQTATLLGDP